MIYLARGVEEYYKIGYSKSKESLENRVKSLQTGCPVKIEVVKTIEGTLDDEKKIHESFKMFREKGEWFSFNDFVLKKVCNYMKQLENENNINFITIEEYDYRIKDHGKYKPNTIECRLTENYYEIMNKKGMYCPGTFADECFEWTNFDLKELSDFPIRDYQILYKWILKNHKEFFSYDNGRYMFDILECSEFDYYLDFKFKLYKIGELLKSDVFSALYKLAGDESPIWDKMIDISSSASTYVHKHQQHLEKITEPRNTLYYEEKYEDKKCESEGEKSSEPGQG